MIFRRLKNEYFSSYIIKISKIFDIFPINFANFVAN